MWKTLIFPIFRFFSFFRVILFLKNSEIFLFFLIFRFFSFFWIILLQKLQSLFKIPALSIKKNTIFLIFRFFLFFRVILFLKNLEFKQFSQFSAFSYFSGSSYFWKILNFPIFLDFPLFLIFPRCIVSKITITFQNSCSVCEKKHIFPIFHFFSFFRVILFLKNSKIFCLSVISWVLWFWEEKT